MIRDGLLALGLLLSTATQLRLPGIPLGPGELLLMTWIVVALVDLACRRDPPLTRPVSHLLLFWALFTFAQSIGLLVGFAREDFVDKGGALHTGQAYALVAVLSLLMVILPAWRLERIAWTITASGAAAVIVLLAGGYGMLPVPSLDFWVWNRFIGWSMNPNQFGLLCTVLVLLPLQIAEAEARLHARILALTCIAPPFIAGILTRSDSFVLAIGLSVPLLVGSKFAIWFFRAKRQTSLATTVAGLMVLSFPVLLASVSPFIPNIAEHARQVTVETMEQNDQAADRFHLWREALEVGPKSGMLGFGPGPHLSTKQWKKPPPAKNEAHNTALDLFTQGGILAILSFIWINAATIFAAFRANIPSLASLVFGLFIFSNFHLVIRHPIYWFSMVMCLALAYAACSRNLRRQSNRAGRISPSLPSRSA